LTTETPIAPRLSAQTSVSRWPFYEFFAGGGMARIGLGPGWMCAFAHDIDERKGASYIKNFGCEGLVVGDIAKLKPADLPGAAELAWASFPCEDVSEAGKHAGLDGFRSTTVFSFLALMKALCGEGRAPRLIVLENVVKLMAPRHNGFFGAILQRPHGCRLPLRRHDDRCGVVLANRDRGCLLSASRPAVISTSRA
jgi:site-specific DNA-cytosine methylase